MSHANHRRKSPSPTRRVTLPDWGQTRRGHVGHSGIGDGVTRNCRDHGNALGRSRWLRVEARHERRDARMRLGRGEES
jgi:hypothetical protein